VGRDAWCVEVTDTDDAAGESTDFAVDVSLE
jgi:hypothetical protein